MSKKITPKYSPEVRERAVRMSAKAGPTTHPSGRPLNPLPPKLALHHKRCMNEFEGTKPILANALASPQTLIITAHAPWFDVARYQEVAV